MQDKAKALRKMGYSYKQIAEQLGIGKTTAYSYVNSSYHQASVISATNTAAYIVPTSSEPVRNDCSDRKNDRETSKNIIRENLENTTKILVQNSISMPKEFTGDQLLVKKFDSLEFRFRFLELIGKPSKLFSAIIWGLPKGGKSNLSIRLADYLHEWFGDVVYIAAEEGESVTMQEKIKAIGGSGMTIVESKDKEQIAHYLKSKTCEFVFIDSINNAGIDNEFLEYLKKENPTKSFIAIVQATKGGNFKGDQSLTHNCDFIIKVVAGIAYHSGRFNTTSEIEIFSSELYQKNPGKRTVQMTSDSIGNETNTNDGPMENLGNIPVHDSKSITDLKTDEMDSLLELFKSEKANPINDSSVMFKPKVRYGTLKPVKSSSIDGFLFAGITLLGISIISSWNQNLKTKLKK